ncbi:MAG: serine hydrolase [Xanthobacteraceae bacterium]
MAWLNVGARNGLRGSLLSLAAIAAALTINSDAAVAHRHHRIAIHHHHARAEGYDPPFASIVVDGNSGAVLQASNPDALRHPASLTKVMTLYLLFERLDAGRVKLDTPLPVSEHASEQDPTKLGLKPGQTITVEDAIKGIVTRSANDAAVVIAEYLGGSEQAFAKMMTQKARALGMAHTTYVNASGLPDDDQNTTARDQALLGRAIQDGFPRYYKYFSTQAFVFRGETIRGHDHLLSEVEGVDGIKTGFTRASGFNLLTSLHRDGRYLVAVVMGGPSASERDARMRGLIADHFKEASLHRTAPVIADATIHRNEPIAFTNSPLSSTKLTSTSFASRADPAPTASVTTPAAGSSAPIKPVLVRTISYRTVPVQTASLAPMPMLVPVGPAAAQPATTQPSVRAQAPDAVTEQRPTVIASAAPVMDLKTPAPQAAPPAAAKPRPMPVASAAQVPSQPPATIAANVEQAPLEVDRAEIADAQPAKLETAIPSGPIHVHGGWLIQIGAFDDVNDAKQHLSAAQLKLHAALGAKDPFTERVQKGDKALYRARFAGFDKQASAEAACRELKRSDFQCMALKD